MFVVDVAVHGAGSATGTQVRSQSGTDGGSAERRPSGPVRRGAVSSRRPIWLHLSVFGGFVLLGLVLWWHVWITGSPTSTITCQCGDPSQELWFLAWTPWALIHGHSPFLSNAIYAGQGGANMMTNTSWMLPAVLLAPVTWLFGPIASFNVAAVLAPAVSGWCFFAAARKLTAFLPAQVLGGLLYGFSPFILQNDPFGHINFTLAFFPPLVFILLYDLVSTHRHSPAQVGVWLAILVVAEFFTSTEMLALSALIIAITLLAAVAMAPRAAWAQRTRVLTGFGVTAAISLPILAYPVWFTLAGPRHIVGVPWADAPQWGTTPSAIVDAGVRLGQSSYFDKTGGYYGAIGPNAGPLHLPSLLYVGIPVLVVIALSVMTWYRWRVAWALVIGTAVAWLFSFGTTFGNVGAGPAASRPWWLPWRLFAHLPLVGDILPIRFGILVTFGVAMLFCVALDRWETAATRWLRSKQTVGQHRTSDDQAAPDRRSQGRAAGFRRARVAAGVVITVVGMAAMAPVAAATPVPFTVRSSSPPAWFTVDAPSLPAGTIVLVVPFTGQRAMGWQAQIGLHVALAGGFAVVPSSNGRSAFVDPPSGVLAVLGRLSPDPLSLVPTTEPSSQHDVAEVRSALEQWHVGATVITQVGRHPTASVAFFTAVYGRIPRFRQGVWVWTGPPGPEPGPLSPTVLAACTTGADSPSTPLAVPRCVLAAAHTQAAAEHG